MTLTHRTCDSWWVKIRRFSIKIETVENLKVFVNWRNFSIAWFHCMQGPCPHIHYFSLLVLVSLSSCSTVDLKNKMVRIGSRILPRILARILSLVHFWRQKLVTTNAESVKRLLRTTRRAMNRNSCVFVGIVNASSPCASTYKVWGSALHVQFIFLEKTVFGKSTKETRLAFKSWLILMKITDNKLSKRYISPHHTIKHPYHVLTSVGRSAIQSTSNWPGHIDNTWRKMSWISDKIGQNWSI